MFDVIVIGAGPAGSTASKILAKMSKGDEVSISVRTKICEKYGCDYGDLISFVDEVKEE